jgi:pyruvate/2-oxoglutarate dehydrogenase complex dihydrolipoamide acyltransferase (E2) component
MNKAPQQATPMLDLAGITRYLDNFKRDLAGINEQPRTNFAPTGQSAWTPVDYQDVNAQRIAGDALNQNLARMPLFSQIAGQATAADTQARTTQLDTINPNWRAERDQASSVNQSWMTGEVGKDMQDQMQRSGAFNSLMSGGYGGDNARKATARDFGLTGIQLQQQGQDSAMKWQQLMGSLLPQVTSAAAVMESQGFSPQQAVAASLTNAQQNLVAQTANSSGMQQASQFNIDASQRGQQLASQEKMAFNQIAAEGAGRIADMGTTAIQNQYASNQNRANVMFGNQYRPWAMTAERYGNLAGQRNSYGYGI